MMGIQNLKIMALEGSEANMIQKRVVMTTKAIRIFEFHSLKNS
jgi:hypothetical protein